MSEILVTVTDSGHQEEVDRDRAAIEAIVGHSMGGDWPAEAMPAGTRVRVIKDDRWDGPWRQVFAGTVDETITPRLVEHAQARPDEFEYSVRFDVPQLDASEDGPFCKAVIWDRYLEPI
jgi:hypothetical protein